METASHYRRPALLRPSYFLRWLLLFNSGELKVGKVISLRRPCGRVILPPILVQSNIQDHQRGLLKAEIERHLAMITASRGTASAAS